MKSQRWLRCALMILLLMCLARPMWAQVQPLASRDVAVFAGGVDPNVGQPVAPLTNAPNALWTCGLPKIAAGPTTVNPTDIRINDPSDPNNRQCQLQQSVTSQIFNAVPEGTGYRLAVRARGATTQAQWSVVSNPFDRVAMPPAIVTGVIVN